MELFNSNLDLSHEPLAARMRPRTLDEYIGQDAIIGAGRLLRRAIQADQLSSVIFYGPPGTGKTTLARVIANYTKSNFITLNAVLSGVQQIRDAIAQAEQHRSLYQQKTILFVDEVHRWNKAQQDALLPWVENGTLILIGATTENPFFEVNKALVSRSRIFQLLPLTRDNLFEIVKQALQDKNRGYGKWNIEFAEGALEHLVDTCSGDARTLLNALELAVETTPAEFPPPENTKIFISMDAAEESIQQKVVLYDRDGDYHYDVISAFIKSLRGRDPDAAIYWLARMIAAGENPNFIFRRMLISASEDTGLADPNAISVVESCAAAFDRVGLPEGRFFLAQATLYLATCPKSNSTMAFFDALATVEKDDAVVPNHLKDSSRDSKGFGHGDGYLYPHAYRDHWTAQQYLPNQLTGKVFYTPSTQGYEAKIHDEVLLHRELQVSALLESSQNGESQNAEILSFSPGDSQREQWVKRTDSKMGEVLLHLRQSMFAQAQLLRHHRVLILNADDGLLLWESMRLCPEGLVEAFCTNQQSCEILSKYCNSLDSVERPVLNYCSEILPSFDKSSLLFDCVLLRDPITCGKQFFNLTQQINDNNSLCEESYEEKSLNEEKNSRGVRPLLTRKPTLDGFADFIFKVVSCLSTEGKIVIAQKIPALGQTLSNSVKSLVSKEVFDILKATETELYSSHPLFSWNDKSLVSCLLEDSRLSEKFVISCKIESLKENRYFSQKDISNWFDTEKSAYGSCLEKTIKATGASLSIAKIKTEIEEVSKKGAVDWVNAIAILKITSKG